MNLSEKISCLKNIGSKRESELNKQNIFTIEDLLYFFPKDYIFRDNIIPIAEIKQGQPVNIKAKVIQKSSTAKVFTAKIADSTGNLHCRWFNQNYLYHTFKDREYVFTGIPEIYNNKLVMINPYFEPEDTMTDLVLPKYKIPGKILAKAVKQALALSIPEVLPENLRLHFGLLSRGRAFQIIHFPKNKNELNEALKYFVIEELYPFQKASADLKKGRKTARGLKNLDTDAIIRALPFKLTADQEKVLDEIKKDFSRGQMYRLIQGDVGSGKTAVGIIACYITVKNDFQGAVMVPTEVLAKQHFNNFANVLQPLGIKVELLTSSTKNKDELKAQIIAGDVDIIIGTHALIQKDVEFNRLGLCLVDEQHRFGVNQRKALSQKSKYILAMTATPIPRSLAKIIYGDLDISIIKNMPKGRKPIATYCVRSSYRERVWAFIKKETDKNRRAYIVCSAIDENPEAELIGVKKYAQKLKAFYKKNNLPITIREIHGKMDEGEKELIMDSFKKGDTQVLVSTTVIEVGVDVPEATIMVIEDAHRFGLSQLHQLRGRVGRGQDKSYCILITDSPTAKLNILTETTDGFLIADKDLSIRGPGEFFGTAQHGLPKFKIANLYRDMDILKSLQDFLNF